MIAQDPVYIALVILGMTAVTVATRCGLLMAGDRLRLPRRLTHALRYAPICALVGLVAPVAVQPDHGLADALLRPEFAGTLVALLTMTFSRSLLLTMALGLLAFLLMR